MIQRRKFIQQFSWLTGGILLTKHLTATGRLSDHTVRGKVTAGGKGISGVVISDGYSVVATDEKGRFEFELHPEAVTVFMSTPSGYAFNTERNIARHYKGVSKISFKKGLRFELTPLDQDDQEHQFFIWADPQVKNEKDVEKMMNQSVPDVQQWVKAAGKGALLHGITVGDIVWDELSLFADYDRAVDKMGIPFFQCIGNHDMDYNKGGDEASDDTFQENYGPTCYSFNRGKVHYVVMDNVRYMGKDREYDGYFQPYQLDWLRKDLSFVPEDRLIIFCVHIPVHNGVKNNKDLYDILGNRPVHIMSGHTHYHRNVINGNIFEHNHGTVCGAWWTGPVCGDGTPCGYGIYQVKGTELSWRYQSTGEPEDHQMKIFINDLNSTEKQVLVNIWNHDPEWKTAYAVDGDDKGALEQIEGFDPFAYKTLLGPDLPKPRGFAEPRKTDHLFQALVPAGAKQVQVTATDRFGRAYSVTRKISV